MKKGIVRLLFLFFQNNTITELLIRGTTDAISDEIYYKIKNNLN
jgi:hypothetical protein